MSLLSKLIDAGPLVHLATVNPDGSPPVSVIWVGPDGDQLVSGHMSRYRKLRARATVEPSGQAWGLLNRLTRVYVSPDAEFPAPRGPGYIVRYETERIGGIGPWASPYPSLSLKLPLLDPAERQRVLRHTLSLLSAGSAASSGRPGRREGLPAELARGQGWWRDRDATPDLSPWAA